jgi:hypothetical protein
MPESALSALFHLAAWQLYLQSALQALYAVSWLRLVLLDKPLGRCLSLTTRYRNHRKLSIVSGTRLDPARCFCQAASHLRFDTCLLPQVNETLGRSCLSLRLFLVRSDRRVAQLGFYMHGGATKL